MIGDGHAERNESSPWSRARTAYLAELHARVGDAGLARYLQPETDRLVLRLTFVFFDRNPSVDSPAMVAFDERAA